MNNCLTASCGAEVVKLKGTLALIMSVLAPVLVVLLFCAQMLLSPAAGKVEPSSAAAWGGLCRGVLSLWCFLMLPLYLTLQAALLGNMEYANNQWKHLLVLPVPRYYHFLGKACALSVLSCTSAVTLCLATLLAGLFMRWIRPSLGLDATAPVLILMRDIAASTAASGLMALLLLYIALRAGNFTVSISAGIAASVAGFLVGQSPRFGPWYPWTMPLHTLTQDGQNRWVLAVVGITGVIVLGPLLCLQLVRRPPG